MRWLVLLAVLVYPRISRAEPSAIRCDDAPTADLSIDGLLDDWGRTVLARVGSRGDGQVALRCAWDGTALALALDVEDERVIRIKGPGHEDHVTVAVKATGKPVLLDVYPGNALAKTKLVKPAKVSAGDSLQPKGFSIEVRIPAAQLAGLTASTPSLDLMIVFVDSDKAAGGDTTKVELATTIELGDRKDLLDDFLRAVRLKRSDIKVDTLADLDPDRRGSERIVAGGTVIGVLTDQFAFVSLPAAKAADVRKVELLPLGARNLKVVSAIVRQSGNGGSRDLLMLWTVWSGQLQPLAQIEIRKEMGANLLESSWKLVKGKQGPELWVEPKSALGFTAESWNEMPADDADAIVVPWDTAKGGVAYSLRGAELSRRDLPAPKKRR
jgi:hypothetical protein